MDALFIIDGWDKIKPIKDTSLDLMRVGYERGHRIAIATQASIAAIDGGIHANARWLDSSEWSGGTSAEFYNKASPANSGEFLPIESFQSVFIRKDPPFDGSYHALCLLLAASKANKTVFVNSPEGLLVTSEKLAALRFPTMAPATCVASDMAIIRRFAERYARVVVKPPFDGSGRGVFATAANHPDFDRDIRQLLDTEPGVPAVVQEFLPEIVNGDVRAMLIDGKFVGAVGRVPKAGDFKANIAMGGTEIAAELTETQACQIEEIGRFLVQNGIIYAGLDFIGDKLIETNVTSPTLVQELRRVSGIDVSPMIWDAIEARLIR